MKKRYIPSMLIVLCLLIAACVGVAYAKYASVKKAENLFLLSSDVSFDTHTYTYAVLDAGGALSIRSRAATVGGGKLIESSGDSYDLTQVYRLPDAEFDSSTPEGVTQGWNTVRDTIASVTVEDDLQLESADVTAWFQSLTKCTELDLSKLTLPASTTTFTDSFIQGTTALEVVSLPVNVTVIGNDCFKSCKELATVTLPDGVTSIGKNAFYGCTALTAVNLGANVEIIQSQAFRNCTALTTVGLEGNTKLKTIDEYAFYSCEKLKTISLPDTITFLGNYCFSGCISLTGVHIPQSLIQIKEGAFSGCVNMKVDTEELIPATVTFVGGNVFENCRSITAKVTIGSKVSVLGYKAFSGCSSITEVTLLTGLSPGSNAFEGTGIREIHIPGSFKLPREMFMNCKDLTTVIIENGVQSIGENVFNGCTNLTTIIIPDSVTTINNQAFGGRDEGSPCVVFYNGTAEGPGNWGDVIVVNSENLGGVPACTLNGDASTMNITLPEEVSADQLLIQIGQNTADGFVSDSTRTVEKKADDTFDISVTDITKKLIVLSPMETYNTYDNPLAGGEEEILMEDDSLISFGESGLVVYDSLENQYAAMLWEMLSESEGFSETFYSGVKKTNGVGISLQAPQFDLYRVTYSGQSADEVTVTAEVGTPYESPVYVVLSFAKFSEDKTTFALEHIAFETTVVIGDGGMRNITFTLPAGYLTRLQTEVAFFSIAGTVSGE